MSKVDWFLKDLVPSGENAPTVFSCFHCAGGSTMGYKRAGFNVLGGVEIDPEMMNIYRENHKPKHSFLMGVSDFNKLKNESLPSELFSLDILDGSPPCSSFSTAGSREKKWGVKTKFREGQSEQVLDDLFFDFIETAKKLKPKIVVAENVSGLIKGNARGYVKQIFNKLTLAGYSVQLFLLNAAFMGVPQARERVFFIAKRDDLDFPSIDLKFSEKPISFSEIEEPISRITADLTMTPLMLSYWKKCKQGKAFSSVHEKGSLFGHIKISASKPLPTMTSASGATMFHYSQQRKLTNVEWLRGQTFPLDFKCKDSLLRYTIGMSVPPFMMQKIAEQIANQLLNSTSP